MKATKQATVQFSDGVSVDAFLMANDSFRYGLSYISVLLGYAPNYYRRLIHSGRTKKPPKKLDALLKKGFTAYQIDINTPPKDQSDSSIAHTVSYEDCCLIVEHEASLGNPKAISLLAASFREVLRSRTQVAFGLPEDSLAEKQKAFQEAYEKCLAENRADLEALGLPGDDRYYPQHQDWIGIEPWGDRDWDQEALDA